jgi:hypothetical protein
MTMRDYLADELHQLNEEERRTLLFGVAHALTHDPYCSALVSRLYRAAHAALVDLQTQTSAALLEHLEEMWQRS